MLPEGIHHSLGAKNLCYKVYKLPNGDGRLTDEEDARVQAHVSMSAKLVSDIGI